MSIQNKYIASNDGTKLYAQAAGDPSKQAVVFLHGYALNVGAFQKQFQDPEWLENFYLVAYDLRGDGRSDHPEVPEAYESIRFAEDFKAVCEAFSVKRPFVFAWSLGAVVLVDIIAAYGASFVRGAIFPGVPVLEWSLHLQYVGAAPAALIPQLDSADSHALIRAANAFVDLLVAYPERDMPWGLRMQWLGGVVCAPVHVRTLILKRPQDATRWWAAMADMPVLLLQGALDPFADLAKMKDVLGRKLGRMEWVTVEDTGHAVHWEKPRETREYSFEFMKKVLS